MKRSAGMSSLALIVVATGCAGLDSPHVHPGEGRNDSRIAAQFPAPLREHTLANMRDHLLTLQQIQEALARNAFDDAARLAETRLGLSSLEAHGAHEVARYMPRGMQDIGEQMHRAASRFALEATDAGASGDNRKVMAALAAITAQCVACHASYKLE
jgi:hypothetical protein